MADEYDFCGVKRGCCNYQINADEKIKTLEKALELACEELETHPYSQWNTNEWFDYFLQKAGEPNEH